MRNLIISIFLMLGLTACSSEFDTSQHKDGSGRVIYQMSQQQAFNLALTSMASFFPGRNIFEVDEQLKGYRTWTTFVVDRYHHYIRVVPAVGTNSAGQRIAGFYFQISGSGTSGSGYASNVEFYEQFQRQLDGLSVAVKVRQVRPGRYTLPVFPRATSTSGQAERQRSGYVEEKLRQLNDLRAKGLITDQEYLAKRQQILNTF